MKRFYPLFALLLFLQFSLVSHAAGPLPQTDGQAYVVQSGDWLSKLADKFFGDPQAWPLIVKATQAKAATDSSFTTIADPNMIEVGQKLWIPTEVEPSTGAAAPIPSSNPADLQQAYLNAVKDAATAEPGEI